MRAIRIHQTGGPEVLKVEEVDLPRPGKGEVRVRHHAIGVNFLDTYHRTGFYPMPLPLTPGGEGAGEVVEVGAGVKDFKPGDRVAYAGPPGGYAEERNIAAQFLVKLPRAIGYDTAAAVILKGLTAQYLLRQTYKVKEGDWILVHAAAGGVGQILCQWGRALGAKVIGTVGSSDKAKVAKKAGANHTILYREEDFAKRVDEITKGQKCAVVYDGVGKDTFPASLDCLKAFRRVRELRLGVRRDRGVRHWTPRPQGVAVRHAADPVHLHGGPGAAREDGARPLPRGRERRRDRPDRAQASARGGRRGAPGAGGARNHGLHRPSAVTAIEATRSLAKSALTESAPAERAGRLARPATVYIGGRAGR